MLFAINRKYHELAYGERKLLPAIWAEKPERKPKIVDFIIETTGKIKGLHAAKKRQQIAAPVVVPAEAPSVLEPAKIKAKVRFQSFVLISHLLTCSLAQKGDQVLRVCRR